ncbi:hypothetical protein Pelo_1249 [Pelomyxa schiedti]|nr:hypothetical protein Pelo_1249 [Pelomyxa schiedti]
MGNHQTAKPAAEDRRPDIPYVHNGDRCCICFAPKVAPYALAVEFRLRTCGVESLTRLVIQGDGSGSEAHEDDFDFAVAVVEGLPKDERVYGLARSTVASKLEATRQLPAPSRPPLPLVVLCCGSIKGAVEADVPSVFFPCVRNLNSYLNLFQLRCLKGLKGVTGAEGPALRGQWSFPLPNGELDSGCAACFVSFFALSLRFLGCEDVHYFTPTHSNETGNYLPLFTGMLGHHGVPVSRDSVDLDSLDLGWLKVLHQETMLVEDTISTYALVHNLFLDITEAFYYSLALALNQDGMHPKETDREIEQANEIEKVNIAPQCSQKQATPTAPLDHQLQEEQQRMNGEKNGFLVATPDPHLFEGPSPLPQTSDRLQLQMANVDQVCCWLRSLGATTECLQVIRKHKLDHSTLVKFSQEQLCEIGLKTADSEIIVEGLLTQMISCEGEVPSPHVDSPPTKVPVLATELQYKCFAFIVDNEFYKTPMELPTTTTPPKSPSLSLCQFLTRCHFKVFEDIRTPTNWAICLEYFKRILRTAREAGDKVTSLLFYTGHGVQWQGEHFLLMTEETGLGRTRLGAVLDQITELCDLTICLLDSFFQLPQFTITQQFTKERFPEGCIVVYPDTGNGSEGTLNQRLLTCCFLEVAETARPGTPFSTLIDATIEMVRTRSHGNQRPWLSKSVPGHFALF